MNKNTTFEGLKVIELATYVAGPSCAHIFADWGAEVIKVEPPHGDAWRFIGAPLTEDDENAPFATDNANKRFIAIDLKTPEGVSILKKMLETADVFVTNTRMSALEKLGLSYDEISKINPRIIYTMALGYGSKGPLKDKPGFDGTAFFARGAIAGDLAQKDGDPVNAGPGFGDHVLGMNLFSGTVSALYKRTKTGKGDLVTSSLYQSAIYLLSSMIAINQYGVEYPSSIKNPINALNNAYKCKDGKWITLAGASWMTYFPKFCEIIGHMEYLENEEYLSPVAGLIYGEELGKLVADEIIKKDHAQWVQILESNDFPYETIQHIPDVMQNEQAFANDYLFKHTHVTGNELVYSRVPIFFESQPFTDFVHTGAIGANTVEILKEYGYTDEQISFFESSDIIVK